MNPPGEIRIEVQWRCPHCGHIHGQGATLCAPHADESEPGLIGVGSMICPHCGQLGPIQLGYAILLGMTVMASSDGVLNLPWPAGHRPEHNPWARSARRPSAN